MANDPSRPQRRMPTANALYDALAAAVNELGEIRAVCERCYAYSRDPQVPVREMWVSGEFPVALGTVMAHVAGARPARADVGLGAGFR